MRSLVSILLVAFQTSMSSAQPPRLAMEAHDWEVLSEGTRGYQAAGGVSVSLATVTPGDVSYTELASDFIDATVGQVAVDLADACPNALTHIEVVVSGISGGGLSDDVSVFVDPLAPNPTALPPVLFSRFNGVVRAEDLYGNVCTDVQVAWFQGQQQQIFFETPLANVDELGCASGNYQALFNGRLGQLAWDAASQRCIAGVSNFYFPARAVASSLAPSTDYGMWSRYYPNEVLGPGADVALVAAAFDTELSTYPYGGLFFDTDEEWRDVRVRPLLIELADNGDVIDRARIMFWENGRGNLVLLDDEPVPGAVATLTPQGLDVLEATHHSLLPYPSLDGFNTLLAARLRTEAWDARGGFGSDVVVRMTDMSRDHQTYFEGDDQQWEGSLAYATISRAARGQFLAYLIALQACRAAGGTGCGALLAPQFCVRDKVDMGDFNIRVDGVSMRFHPQEAQRIGGLGASVDLAFRNAPGVGITSRKNLEDLALVLEGDLMPHVSIEYKRSCQFNLSPAPPTQRLDEQPASESDPAGWAHCARLDATASSSTIDSVFTLASNADSLDTVHISSTGAWTFDLPRTNRGDTCNETWMDPALNVIPAVQAWQGTIDAATAETWGNAAGESEALDRLLSPMEIGSAHVDSGLSAPFDLYAHDFFEQVAQIAAAPFGPIGLHTSSNDGLFVPYLTNTLAEAEVPRDWRWPCFSELGNSNCGESWQHETSYPSAGMDTSGASYHVGIETTHMFANQTMWAQAHHPELLGSFEAPAIIDEYPMAIHAAAGASNTFLDAHPDGFEIRVYATQAPFFATPDSAAANVVFVAPQIVVELRSAPGPEEVLAQFLIDVVDRDFGFAGVGPRLFLGTAWGRLATEITTVQLPEGCAGTAQGTPGGCEGGLAQAVHTAMTPAILSVLQGMALQTPNPGVWDAGGEAELAAVSLGRARSQGAGYQLAFYGDFVFVP